MKGERWLAVDWGRVRWGLAISDELCRLAHPRGWVSATSVKRAVAHVTALCETESVTGLVVGLPLHLQGEESTSARNARWLGQRLSEATELPVIYSDERCTSLEADALLPPTKRRTPGDRDTAAACLILQRFLDRRKGDLSSY